MPNCTGRPDQNAHLPTPMVFVKQWTMQGHNQKKALNIELWKCPQCGRVKRVSRKD